MSYSTTVSLDKLLCTEYVDNGKGQDRFGWLSCFKKELKDSNYLDVTLKVFKRDDNRSFCPVRSLTMERENFNQFIRLMNQLVIAAENYGRGENLCWYPQCPVTCVDNSNWLTRWLMYWTKQTERFVWFSCGRMWKSPRVHRLKSDYLQKRRRKRSFNKLLLWNINMKNLSIYLM